MKQLRKAPMVLFSLLALVSGAGDVVAQTASIQSWEFVYRSAAPIDYSAAIADPRLSAIRMPPAPQPPPRLVEFHHGAATPNYAEAFLPREPAAVPIPRPPAGRSPAVVRGLYLNGWVFGSSRFYDLLHLADSTEINSFVIDVKDASGYLTYRSGVPTAVAIGANNRIRAPDAAERLATLRAHGIHPIARIVVARDPLLAERKPTWAVHDVDGGLWRDGLRQPWVDAYNDSVWIYAGQLAQEAVLLGFHEIQFDYVRFPDEPPRRLRRAVYPARLPNDSKRAAVARHVALLRNLVQPLGVPFTLDVFGLTTRADGDMGIGQNWDDLSRLADVMLPMVYPSHYPRGSYGYRVPNAQPYDIVRHALEDALERQRREAVAATRFRPYLQAFSIFGIRYTAEEVRAQIRAVEDVGLTDWILWNARGVYPAEALRRTAVSTQSAASVTSGQEH